MPPDEDDAIQFPPSALTRPSHPAQVFTLGGLEDDPDPMCYENIHFFRARPGRCRCGAEFWEIERG